jgi:hypothetical protein
MARRFKQQRGNLASGEDSDDPPLRSVFAGARYAGWPVDRSAVRGIAVTGLRNGN